ncbi:fatty acid synthase beta subunit dehydratase [Apiospora kogelbergensis]|uniref:fatty acid synthase beta subunit dehydratase n=1 Tax=Apiospora kogelbergensis TaxID=1337665 RepID=UPI00312EDC93
MGLPVLSDEQVLASAAELIEEDLKGVKIDVKSLRFAVYNTCTGKDIREEVKGDIVPSLVRMITRDPVHWERATVFAGATHVLDFGPGGISGLGILTGRNKEGAGVRVILAGVLNGTLKDVGYKPELFDRDEKNAVVFADDWVKKIWPTRWYYAVSFYGTWLWRNSIPIVRTPDPLSPVSTTEQSSAAPKRFR